MRKTLSENNLLALLKEARLSKGYTQSQLAQLLGLPQSYISQVEQGRHDIQINTLTNWARMVDLEVMLIPRDQTAAVAYLIKSTSSQGAEVPPAYGPLSEEA